MSIYIYRIKIIVLFRFVFQLWSLLVFKYVYHSQQQKIKRSKNVKFELVLEKQNKSDNVVSNMETFNHIRASLWHKNEGHPFDCM